MNEQKNVQKFNQQSSEETKLEKNPATINVEPESENFVATHAMGVFIGSKDFAKFEIENPFYERDKKTVLEHFKDIGLGLGEVTVAECRRLEECERLM